MSYIGGDVVFELLWQVSIFLLLFFTVAAPVHKEICLGAQQRCDCFHLDPNELDFVDENRQTSPVSLIDCFVLKHTDRNYFSVSCDSTCCVLPLFPKNQWIFFCNIKSGLHAGIKKNKKKNVFMSSYIFRQTEIQRFLSLLSSWCGTGEDQNKKQWWKILWSACFWSLRDRMSRSEFCSGDMLLHLFCWCKYWDVLMKMSSLINAGLRASKKSSCVCLAMCVGWK